MTTTPASETRDPSSRAGFGLTPAGGVLRHLERGILREVVREAIRAHDKHRDHSMAEPYRYTEDGRLVHLVEEVGEVARCLSEAAQGRPLDRGHLRQELVEVAHLAALWAALLDVEDV